MKIYASVQEIEMMEIVIGCATGEVAPRGGMHGRRPKLGVVLRRLGVWPAGRASDRGVCWPR
jgi:hypothetical protein